MGRLNGYTVHMAAEDKVSEASEFVRAATSKSIIIFDEAQRWFAADHYVLTTVLKEQTPVRAVFITTSNLRDLRLQKSTPSELGASQFWFSGPSADQEKVRQYITRVLQETRMSSEYRELLSRTLFPMCGNHVGVLSAMLSAIVEDATRVDGEGMFPLLQVQRLFQQRVLGGGNGKWSSVQEDCMREILACGSKLIRYSDEPDQGIKNLVHTRKHTGQTTSL